MNLPEELDYSMTRLGALVLRRRPEPVFGGEFVYEVKLGEEFLMSSAFVVAEEMLAHLGLEDIEDGADVIVGGLGLGYTAAAALQHLTVKSCRVIELFEPVISWHERRLVPAAKDLMNDPRCELVNADFFKRANEGFDPDQPGKLFDAILLDIDHTPDHQLDSGNAPFYSHEGLKGILGQLREGGRFGMWSDDEADDDFVNLLRDVFGMAESHNIKFPNPYSGRAAVNTVYIARKKTKNEKLKTKK